MAMLYRRLHLSLSWRQLAVRRYASEEGSKQASHTSKKVPQNFHRASHGAFIQASPQLYNTFIEDAYLRHCLEQKLPSEVKNDVFQDLERFGSRISSEVEAIGRDAEENPPSLQQFDAWGRRVDKLCTSQAWKRMHAISAEEGLVSIAFERKHSQWSRLHQAAKLFLYCPSSGLYSCPLAMTDGAAKLIESSDHQELMQRTFPKLTSRDPDYFWTSGQWMTEKGGGSDVAGGTETVAVPEGENRYCLYGYKWFSSATDANVAFTLARALDNNGMVTQGTRGLSLFYVETLNANGDLNGIQIQRLKNKLGTRQLPTAELLLDGTVAQIVGEAGRGIAGITPMLTITRLHNAISAVGSMRRMLQLARDYSTKRMAFGKYLADHPLHMRILAQLEVETRGAILLSLELAHLLGKEECGQASQADSLLLRLMTPVAKLFTAKQSVMVASEGLESFGGQGYIEDTGLPTIYRDAQVLPIWEGTTNILSMDVLRALKKTDGKALQELVAHTKSVTSQRGRLQHLALDSEAEMIDKQLDFVVDFIERAALENPTVLEVAARDIALSLAHVYTGSLLLKQACETSSNAMDFATTKRWCRKTLPLQTADSYSRQEEELNVHLVMDGFQQTLTTSKNV